MQKSYLYSSVCICGLFFFHLNGTRITKDWIPACGSPSAWYEVIPRKKTRRLDGDEEIGKTRDAHG